MTSADRPRTDPIAGHVYTFPVVREVPIAGSLSPSLEPRGPEQTPVYAADAHGW